MAGLFNSAVAVVVAALVIWALWYAAQTRCVFRLALDQGRLHVVRGKVTPAFLEAAQSVCTEAGVTHGEIRGVWRGRAVALAFTPTIPAEVQQRLRNIWLLHR